MEVIDFTLDADTLEEGTVRVSGFGGAYQCECAIVRGSWDITVTSMRRQGEVTNVWIRAIELFAIGQMAKFVAQELGNRLENAEALLDAEDKPRGDYAEYPTEVHGIVRRVYSDYRIQLVDSVRHIYGPIAQLGGIATLEMPDELKDPETGRGYWMYLCCSRFWAGELPVETLLEVY